MQHGVGGHLDLQGERQGKRNILAPHVRRVRSLQSREKELVNAHLEFTRDADLSDVGVDDIELAALGHDVVVLAHHHSRNLADRPCEGGHIQDEEGHSHGRLWSVCGNLGDAERGDEGDDKEPRSEIAVDELHLGNRARKPASTHAPARIHPQRLPRHAELLFRRRGAEDVPDAGAHVRHTDECEHVVSDAANEIAVRKAALPLHVGTEHIAAVDKAEDAQHEDCKVTTLEAEHEELERGCSERIEEKVAVKVFLPDEQRVRHLDRVVVDVGRAEARQDAGPEENIEHGEQGHRPLHEEPVFAEGEDHRHGHELC
mmetsp:Transcript_17523/g.50895  ORF Transcript_17523/g.50895 Transcript_17523/m.50895 type:complete len:315 (-) Transcript_17523:1554-2498(-)